MHDASVQCVTHLKRVTAWVFLFMDNCRSKEKDEHSSPLYFFFFFLPRCVVVHSRIGLSLCAPI